VNENQLSVEMDAVKNLKQTNEGKDHPKLWQYCC